MSYLILLIVFSICLSISFYIYVVRPTIKIFDFIQEEETMVKQGDLVEINSSQSCFGFLDRDFENPVNISFIDNGNIKLGHNEYRNIFIVEKVFATEFQYNGHMALLELDGVWGHLVYAPIKNLTNIVDRYCNKCGKKL